MQRFSAFLLALILAVGAVLAPQSAEARRVWPAVGGSGEISVPQECPAGQVLVGFAGRSGLWIDQIQLMCAPLKGDGFPGTPAAFGDQFGGIGGGPNSATCAPATKLAAATFELTGDSKKVAYIMLQCVDRNGSPSSFRFGGTQRDTASTKKNCGGIIAAGCDPDEVGQPRHVCPQESFTGITVRYGLHVNAVGIICDGRAPLSTAAVAPPTAQAPPKPIKRTGAGSGGGNQYALVGAPWSITQTPGASFRLVMHADEDNGSNAYWGEMLFDDARQNGTLIGTLEGGGIFRFTYEQPKAGKSGSGSLKALSDKFLGGESKSDKDASDIAKWKGVR